MGHGKPLILFLWFATTPFAVVLFAHLGWGPDGVIAAILVSSGLWWLISFVTKKVLAAFPNKSSALHFMASGQMPTPTATPTAVIPYEHQGRVEKDEEFEDDEDEEFEDDEDEEFEDEDETEDLHPAVVMAGRALPEHRFRLNLGSHTLDLDTVLDQVLIDEHLPEGSRSLSRILAEEFGGKLRFTLVIVDLTDGFATLLTELPRGFLLGGREKHEALPKQLQQRAGVIDRGTATKLGRALMQERGQCIFRFSSFANYVEACANLLLFLQGIYRWEKEHIASGGSPVPCVIMLNQAHVFLPHDSTFHVACADPAVAQVCQTHLMHYLKARGDFGMYLYLISEYASRMPGEVLAECGLWLLRETQYEELYYLSKMTRLNLMAQMRNMPAEAALLLDVVARKSFPVMLRQSKSMLELDGLFSSQPPTLAIAALAAPSTVEAPETTRMSPSTVTVQASFQEPTTGGLSGGERSTDAETAGETPGGFPQAWLVYASYLYATGRLTPTALRRIPDQLFELALALGLNPVRGQDAMNGKRAIRLVGIVQGMGKDQRGKYARQARQYAQTQSSLGGASSLGPSPPGRDGSALWALPKPGLLQREQKVEAITKKELGETAQLITRLLAEYDVYVSIRPEECAIGHTLTRYAARPSGKPKLRKNPTNGQMEGVRDPSSGMLVYEKMTTVDQITAREQDLATKLAVDSVRIARVPGKPFVGVEVPLSEEARTIVRLRDIIASPLYQENLTTSKVLFPIGKDVIGEIKYVDLSDPDHPHMLIAGATGGGKSIFLRSGIVGILMQASPEEVRMWMVDPKMVELKPFSNIPHLIDPIITDLDLVPGLLQKALTEAAARYALFETLEVTNLQEYQALRAERIAAGDAPLKNLPEILIIIDELGELMMVSPDEVEEGICRLGQIARACGIHLIVATQRPEVKIVTGRIKANLPYRVAFRVSSVDDSKVIIGKGGVQLLLGKGDMLAGPSGRLERCQGAMVEKVEVIGIVSHWRQQASRNAVTSPLLDAQSPFQKEAGQRDEASSQERQEGEGEGGALLQRVIDELPQKRKVSVEEIKEQYNVSHKTAKPIIDQLKKQGLIGEYSASLKGHPVRIVNIPARPEREQERNDGEEEERSQTS